MIPRRATVVVDGDEVGTARHFNGYRDALWLQPGLHTVEFQVRGYMTLRVRVDAKEGRYYKLQYRLRKGEGVDPRSSGKESSDGEGEQT